MHARISTWMIRSGDYEQVSQQVDPIAAELTRHPGYLAGYEVQAGPDRLVTITVWESEAQLDAAFEAVMPALNAVLEGRMELVDRTVGPAKPLAGAS